MRSIFSAPVLLMLCACGPSSGNNDPLRGEFLDACMEMKAYQSIKAEKRLNRCECTYDKAIRTAPEEAQNMVRFYLLEQAGAEKAAKDLVSKPPDMKNMVDASKAIGEAVKQCR